MDNLTHALAGMLIAEAAMEVRASARAAARAPRPGWRSAAYVASVAGNNLPDVDFLWSGITARPFGYLLHHRGHSHTLPGAIACTLLVFAVVTAFARARKLAWSQGDWGWMVALCVLGPLVHIAMDSSNNYGTHPFWPFYRSWIYGDAVFIVEPLFWAAGVPALVFAARSAVTRLTLAAVLALGIALTFYVRFVPMPMAIAVALLALACTAMAWCGAARVRALAGIGACVAVAAVFFVASRAARAAVRAALPQGTDLLEVVVTPLPANPLCFIALTVERGEVSVATPPPNYIAQRAAVATWPALYAARDCPDPEDRPTAPFSPMGSTDTTHVHWRGAYVAPLAELTSLYRDNCQAAALLRFVRVPYWVPDAEGALIMGDLRYDRNPGLDFSDARLERRPTFCPEAVPSWTPPRRDLFGD